ncbi:MBL fold metallo-hydrolase [Actinoplanes derwentensis]|uniref:Glyoxylase, beta-lactamase superfamily II n=1 Tax=Actinoplanes derwentensis TaxID=113562 RepID=A0A1H2B0I3_9ACTN|nr:MBL fold metallo-hydrolase [Actinoplanes derwentensis]GID87217.1 MBL fold metallo-hydrolase [Actinoplanes derwentensis]SDT51296.1 Glyoxylase, beta-lactamase superfamily II [Actinoplanes derwentensis]
MNAQQAAWRARTLPPVEKLAGGLVSVPVPIPNNPLRYTLSYLIPGDDGLVVVDPGWDSDPGWAALLAGLAEAGATAADVTGVVLTHVHPDHHGLTARLRDASGAWVAMHPAERDSMLRDRDTAPSVALTGWLRDLHVPQTEINDLLGTFGSAVDEHFAPLADPDVMLGDGDLVPLTGRHIRAIWTPGHTPGHLCLLDTDAQVLLTGDHVLPRISPNIGLQLSGGDPLGDYLESLAKVTAYDDCEALPGHEYRFHGIAARAAELTTHHRDRCAEIVATVERLGAPGIWPLAAALSWSRPWSEIGPMKVAAVAETAAHVELLIKAGTLTRKQAADGTQRLLPG